MVVHRLMLALLMVTGLLVCATKSRADEADKPSDKGSAKEKDAGPGETKDAAKPNPYEVPEGGVKELLAFIKTTKDFHAKSREEAIEFQKKGRPALRKAAEKVLETANDEEKQLEGYKEIPRLLLVFRAQDSASFSFASVKQLVADIKAALAGDDPITSNVVMAARQLSAVEYSPNPDVREHAGEVLAELGDALAGNANPATAKIGRKMQGAVRRLNLLGQPLEVSGTLMDGAKFDWAQYRGRVVLVDFWATWCGPCIGELPNVKKCYEQYHDRGFDVVGISLDQDRGKLEKFLEKEQTAWPTIHDGAWEDNAVATYYGVVGIPTVILVDREGKVVSTRARGDELRKQLESLLGPATAGDDEKPATESK
jgi:thiol-disulfide isomerase/thioredoxin